MWGSQGWNQWALQPAMFNDVPHEQIDWAELAKQWIQMQQAKPPDVMPPVPGTSPLPHPGPPVPIPPQEFPEGNIPPSLKAPTVVEHFHGERPFVTDPVDTFVSAKPVDNSYWSKAQWDASAAGDIDERMWGVPPHVEPPPPPPPAGPLLLGKETFDYGHVHDNPPLAMQSVDYNHMSEFSFNQMYPADTHYDQYWSQVNATAPPPIAPMFLKKERSGSNSHAEEDTSHIDAVKRKQLPAWIREGLEKMEQERLKRLERERASKESSEKLQKASAEKKTLQIGKEPEIVVPSKSKFDSDSESDHDEDTKPVSRSSSIMKCPPSPVDTRTEEEKRQDMMLKIRRMLTEILLSVTNTEMTTIAQEVYKKALSKAPARQLASSASLSSLAPGLCGLASYGTESEASEDDDKEDSDSDEELQRRIREKRKSFAIKEKKILADLERKQQEERERAELEKMKHGNEEDGDFIESDKIENPENASSASPPRKLNDNSPFPEPLTHSASNEIPFISETIDNNVDATANSDVATCEVEQQRKKDKRSTSESSSGSSRNSGSESDSRNEKRRKRDKSKRKSSSRNHGRSGSKDSINSDDRSRKDKYHSSSSRKKSSRRRSGSSSSGSTSHKSKHSSKSKSSYNHRRKDRSQSRERRHRRSRSSSYSRYSRSNSKSRSHKYSHSSKSYDRDKYSRRHRDEKSYSRRSHSPSWYAKLPKKYRTSRSPSSESGKKSKSTSWK